MKTKIELNHIPKMTIKEFQALAQREFKRLANANIATEIVVVTDFLFSCGTIGSVVLPGSGSDLDAYYKAQKTRKEKDAAQGTCVFKDGKIQINLLDGHAKAADLMKGLKKVKIGFDTVVTKNAPAETTTTEKAEVSTKTAEVKAPPAVAAVPNEQLASGLDKVKMSFQKMRDIMPRAIAGTTTPEDLQAFAQLQQQIQQWFAVFTATPPAEQAPFKDQAVKLKEQYSKIAAIVQKNKPK
jgi:hypothetical protein